MIKQLLRIPDESIFKTSYTGDPCHRTLHTYTVGGHTDTRVKAPTDTAGCLDTHAQTRSVYPTALPSPHALTHLHRGGLALPSAERGDFVCLRGGEETESGREMPACGRTGSDAREHLELLGGDQGIP